MRFSIWHRKSKIVLCLTLGLSFSKAKAETQFSLFTYNVQMRPVLDNNSYKGSRISPQLNLYDIVAIQESFDQKNTLMSAVTHPYQAHFTDKRYFFTFVDSGLSSLSRFPISSTKKVHYRSYAGFQDAIASKGILKISIEIEGHTIDVYNTHMQATGGRKGTDARLDQAAQLVEFVNKNSPTTHSVILIGDFNMGPPHEGKIYRNVHDIKSSYAFQMVLDNLKLTDMFHTLDYKTDSLDRIMFRSACGYSLKATSFRKDYDRFKGDANDDLSDGLPLVGMFTLKKSGENCTAEPLISSNPKDGDVRLFRRCAYQSAWLGVQAGKDVDLHVSRFLENKVYSVQVGEGTRALLLENKDGNGKQACLKESVPCLGRGGKLEFIKTRFVKVYSENDPDLPEICL